MDIFEQGTTRRIRTVTPFTDVDGTVADPTTVTLWIKTPDGTETAYTDTDLAKVATGDYYLDLTLDQAGMYAYQWEGTGAVAAVDEEHFYVTATAFVGAGGGGMPIQDGSVTTAKLADGAVTTPKLADASITAAKLAPGLLVPYDVKLTHAQMLTLPTTDVELIPAPGIGYALYAPIVLGEPAFMAVMHGTVAYSNVYTDVDLEFSIRKGTDYACYVNWGRGPNEHLAEDLFGTEPPTYWMPSIAYHRGSSGAPNEVLSRWDNAPLMLKANNSTLGDFTGGDPSNTLSFRIWCAIVPTVSFGA